MIFIEIKQILSKIEWILLELTEKKICKFILKIIVQINANKLN